MLVLKRKEGQWVEIRHKSGDRIRIRVYNIRPRFPGQLDLAFDDDALNFEVQRPERVDRDQAPGAGPEDPPRGGGGTDPGAGSESFPLRPLARSLSRRALGARRNAESR